MARKTKSAPARPPAPTGLAISDLRIRLEFLEHDNEKLLKQIQKKRTELDNLLAHIQDIGVELSQRSAPLLQKLFDLDRQIHEIFAEIFAGRKLGKKTRKDIEKVYRNLQFAGFISPKLDEQGQPPKSIFDIPNDDDDESEQEWYEYHRSRPDLEKDAPKPERHELKKIRQLFLRLAEVFHPDKVSADADQEYHAEVMKEVNQAYQNGDLAKLLAIEKQHQMGEEIDRNSEDDLTRRCKRIEQENEFLKSQFDNLKKELRLAKSSQQGSIAVEHRKLSKIGIDPIGEALAETESQIEIVAEIHEFVADFRDRRITIQEFLRGPAVVQEMPGELQEELFEELLSDFLFQFEKEFR